MTDTETLSYNHKSGNLRLKPKLVYRVEKGPGHYVFVDRNTPKVLLPPSVIQESVLTRAQEARMNAAGAKDGVKDTNGSGGAPPPNDTPVGGTWRYCKELNTIDDVL